MTMNRRTLMLSLAAACALPMRGALAGTPVFYRNAGCGCCHAWTDRMADAGMRVTLEDTEDLAGQAARLGIPQGLEGCHVGEIEGYVISGHVPPEDIRRLLAERPEANGLIVPGMPVGSPGMEMGGQTDPYEVLLLGRDGRTSVYASHG